MSQEQYRYLGDYATLLLPTPTGKVEVRGFGQPVTLDKETADSFIIHGNMQIIPESEFAGLGFTDKDLKDYPTAKSHTTAPPEFLAKKEKALQILHDLREQMKAPEAVEAAREAPAETPAVEEKPEEQQEAESGGNA